MKYSRGGEKLATARVDGRPVGLAATPNGTVMVLVTTGRGSACVEYRF